MGRPEAQVLLMRVVWGKFLVCECTSVCVCVCVFVLLEALQTWVGLTGASGTGLGSESMVLSRFQLDSRKNVP